MKEVRLGRVEAVFEVTGRGTIAGVLLEGEATVRVRDRVRVEAPDGSSTVQTVVGVDYVDHLRATGAAPTPCKIGLSFRGISKHQISEDSTLFLLDNEADA